MGEDVARFVLTGDYVAVAVGSVGDVLGHEDVVCGVDCDTAGVGVAETVFGD